MVDARGRQNTPSELKESSWVIKGRRQVKNNWYACLTCRKLTSPSFQELAAPLPLNRLKKAQAFNVTGVDFSGPLYCKKKPTDQESDEDWIPEDGDHKLYKCYVYLFTCAVQLFCSLLPTRFSTIRRKTRTSLRHVL